MVTLKVSEMIFRKPVKAGQHLRIYGKVASLGNSSITLSIEARRYNLYSGGEEAIVCTTDVTFVRIDDDGSPTPIGESIRTKHLKNHIQ